MKTTTLILNIRTLAMTSLMALGGLFFSSPAFGATRVWQPTSGTNDYNTVANWSSGIMPTNGDVAYFAGTGTQTVSLNDNPATNANVVVATTSGTLTFESTKSTPGTLTLRSTSTTTLGSSSGANIVIQKTGTSDFLFSANALAVGTAINQSNNTVTVQGAGVTLEATGGGLTVGANNSFNNLVHIRQGAHLNTLIGAIGKDTSAKSTVRLSDAGTIWTLVANPGNRLTIGDVNGAGGGDNHLIVENGALLRSTIGLSVYQGTVHLDNGTIDLTYDAGGYTVDQALVFQDEGRLRGRGTLLASTVSSSQAGTIVEVGENGFGVLNATLTGASGWNNANIKLELGIGDMTGMPVAGVDYDYLNITGSFTLGGALEIDLASAAFSLSEEFALINWTNYSGSPGNFAVSFINGDSSFLQYDIRNDGFYLSAVPEPSSMMLILGGAVAALAWRMRQRKAWRR